jgi:hypothetical protein
MPILGPCRKSSSSATKKKATFPRRGRRESGSSAEKTYMRSRVRSISGKTIGTLACSSTWDSAFEMAFLSQLAVGQELRSGKLTTVNLLDAEPLGRSLDVIHPRNR